MTKPRHLDHENETVAKIFADLGKPTVQDFEELRRQINSWPIPVVKTCYEIRDGIVYVYHVHNDQQIGPPVAICSEADWKHWHEEKP